MMMQHVLLFASGFLAVEIVALVMNIFFVTRESPVSDLAIPHVVAVRLSAEKLAADSVWVKSSERWGIRRRAFVVSPTYQRRQQIPELVRVAQALYPVRKYVKEWIIVEEYEESNEFDKEEHVEKRKDALKAVLDYFEIPMKFLFAEKQPMSMRRRHYVGKGLESRKVALKYLQKQKVGFTEGVLYWADDDNVYDSEIFTWSENITTVGIWPVGAMWKGVVSSPILRNGSVVNYFDAYLGRRFCVDFAGFATNIKLLENVKDFFHGHGSLRGLMESSFLHSLKIDKSDLRPFGDNCTRAVAWHTKTKIVR